MRPTSFGQRGVRLRNSACTEAVIKNIITSWSCPPRLSIQLVFSEWEREEIQHREGFSPRIPTMLLCPMQPLFFLVCCSVICFIHQSEEVCGSVWRHRSNCSQAMVYWHITSSRKLKPGHQRRRSWQTSKMEPISQWPCGLFVSAVALKHANKRW